MIEKDLVLIGSILKPRGLRGSLKIICPNPEILPKSSFEVFISKQGGFIPFTVEFIKLEPQHILIQFLEIPNLEMALPLCGLDLFVDKALLKKKKKIFSFLDLQGYELWDEKKGLIGVLIQILELPQQWIGIILENGRELLIPLNSDLLVSIDKKNRKVFCQLPEGLLDIYRIP